MARRKSGEGVGEVMDAPFGGDGGTFDIGQFRGTEAPLIGGPDEAQFGLGGSPSPGLTGEEQGRLDSDMAAGVFDDPLAGNTELARSLRPSSSTPTNTFGLPKGVSVNEGMFSGVPESGNSMDAPAMPMSPSPISARPTQPGYGMPEGGTNRGPQRRSPSSPAIYGETNNPSLFGAAGGLLGGGKGAVGTEEPSGPLAPTEMMKRLLQMFQQG